MLTGWNHQARRCRQDSGIGITDLHRHIRSSRRRQRQGHGIAAVHTDGGASGRQTQRWQVDHFNLGFCKSQSSVTGRDLSGTQAASLYFQVSTGLTFWHRDAGYGRCHRGHAARDIDQHTARRSWCIKRDAQQGHNTRAELELRGLQRQWGLTDMHKPLLHQVRNTNYTPYDLRANGARWYRDGIERVAIGGVACPHGGGRQVNGDGWATVVIDGGIVDDRGRTFNGNTTAVFNSHKAQLGQGIVGACRKAPLAPVTRSRGGSGGCDFDGLVEGAYGLERTFFEGKAGGGGHLDGDTGLDAQGGAVVQYYIALEGIGRLSGTQGGVTCDSARDRGLGHGGTGPQDDHEEQPPLQQFGQCLTEQLLRGGLRTCPIRSAGYWRQSNFCQWHRGSCLGGLLVQHASLGLSHSWMRLNASTRHLQPVTCRLLDGSVLRHLLFIALPAALQPVNSKATASSNLSSRLC